MQGSWARECGALVTWWGRGAAIVYVLLLGSIMTGLLSRMPKEDEAMKDTFPQEWEEWAERVSYMLIPGVV